MPNDVHYVQAGKWSTVFGTCQLWGGGRNVVMACGCAGDGDSGLVGGFGGGSGNCNGGAVMVKHERHHEQACRTILGREDA